MVWLWAAEERRGASDPGEWGLRSAAAELISEPCLPGGVMQQERGFEPSGLQKPAQGRWLHRETLEKQFPAGFVENLWFDLDLEVSITWATLYPFGSNRPLAGASAPLRTAGSSFPPGSGGFPWFFPQTAVGSEESLLHLVCVL